MKFPSIAHVADVLRAVNETVEGICDVRLQVYPNGLWAVRTGLPDYDQDLRGYWGASYVPGDRRRFNSRDVARDLIEQAREMHAMGVES